MQKDEFFSIRLIYFALLVGQVMFMIVAYIAATAGNMVPDPETAEVFLYISPIMIVSTHLIGSMLFPRFTTKEKILYADGQPNYNAIRQAYIIRWALLEGANLFTITSFLITNNIYFVYFFLAGMVLYLTTMPKRIWENVR